MCRTSYKCTSCLSTFRFQNPSKIGSEFIGIHFALTFKCFVFSPTPSFGECLCVCGVCRNETTKAIHQLIGTTLEDVYFPSQKKKRKSKTFHFAKTHLRKERVERERAVGLSDGNLPFCERNRFLVPKSLLSSFNEIIYFLCLYKCISRFLFQH